MSWILCIANDIYELSLLQNISYSYGKVAGRIFETILPVELYAYSTCMNVDWTWDTRETT